MHSENLNTSSIKHNDVFQVNDFVCMFKKTVHYQLVKTVRKIAHCFQFV